MIPGRDSGSAFLESFRYAACGIREAARARNFRVQSFVGILSIVLGIVFRIQPGEWLAIIICIGLVLGGECLNTSLENVVDLASPQINPLAKVAKDCAAGAVLCFSITSLAVAIIIFLPKILPLFIG